MPRTKTITLYEYDELPTERAKERAREWYRDGTVHDNSIVEHTVEDFADGLKALGFEVSKRRGTRTELALYWDTNPIGGAFDATWSAGRFLTGVRALLSDRPREYNDATGKVQLCEVNQIWHTAAEALNVIVSQYPDAYGSVTSGRYMNVTAEFNDGGDSDSEPDDAAAEDFAAVCRDLAHALGRAVNAEWEYQTSDETVAETIRANEYTFTEDGKREEM